MPVSRIQLRERAKRLAGLVNSNAIDASTWEQWCNDELAALHDILILTSEDYKLTSSTVTLVNGTAAYALPADFYKVRGVDFVQGSSAYTLERYEFAERNNYRDTTLSPSTISGPMYEYRIEGNNLRLIPTPGTGTLTLWYVPQAVDLADDTDTTDVQFVTGWEDWVTLGMAIRALAVDESDFSALALLREKVEARIKAVAKQRDRGAPKRVADVRGPSQRYARRW